MNICEHLKKIKFKLIYEEIIKLYGRKENDFYICKYCKIINETYICLICFNLYCLKNNHYLNHYESNFHNILYNLYTGEILCLNCEKTLELNYEENQNILDIKKKINKYIKLNKTNLTFKKNILKIGVFKNEYNYNYLQIGIYWFYFIKPIRNNLIQIFYNQIELYDKLNYSILSNKIMLLCKIWILIKSKKIIENDNIDYFLNLLENKFKNIKKSILVNFYELINYFTTKLNKEINFFNKISLIDQNFNFNILISFKCQFCNYKINKNLYLSHLYWINYENNLNIYECIRLNLLNLKNDNCFNCTRKNSLKEKKYLNEISNYLFIYFKNFNFNWNLEINLKLDKLKKYKIISKNHDFKDNLKIKFIIYLKKELYTHYEYILILCKKNKFYEISKNCIIELKSFDILNYNKNIVLVVYKKYNNKNNLKSNIKNIVKIKNDLIKINKNSLPIPIMIINNWIYSKFKEKNYLIKDLFYKNYLKFTINDLNKNLKKYVLKNMEINKIDKFKNNFLANYKFNENKIKYSLLKFLIFSIDLPKDILIHLLEKYYKFNNYNNLISLNFNKENILKVKKLISLVYLFKYLLFNDILKDIKDDNYYLIHKDFINNINEFITIIENINENDFEEKFINLSNLKFENEIVIINNLNDLKYIFSNFYFVNFKIFLIINYIFNIDKILLFFKKTHIKINKDLSDYKIFIDNIINKNDLKENIIYKYNFIKNNKLKFLNIIQDNVYNQFYSQEDFIQIINKYKIH